MSQIQNQTLKDLVREQLDLALAGCRSTRQCPGLEDRDFLFEGVVRVLGAYDSGRDWLQHQREQARASTPRSTAFDALNSPRRHTTLAEASEALQRNLARELAGAGVDHLADFPELADWNVLAADGHAVEHASHSTRDERGRHVADAGLFTLDLRTGLTAFLRPVAGDGRHAHEWPAFKACVRHLRCVTRTLWVVDRAFIDNGTWDRFRRQGIYQITRLKENMYPVEEQTLKFDRTDPVNVGVRRFARVRFQGVPGFFLLVDFRDPETGQRYQFLSSLPETFRPGLIAWLYLLRWKIEKLYDTFKNKLHQTKAWANSPSAAAIRPMFVSMTYNLLLWLQHRLSLDFGIADDKVARKFDRQLAQRTDNALASDHSVHPLHAATLPQRMAQMTAQFIRCVANHLFIPKPFRSILPAFRQAQWVYL
ncbi:MAG: transposase [Desulfobulbaceae bacterium]|nr:transposase [Desulfobulbaceae bacterium]